MCKTNRSFTSVLHPPCLGVIKIKAEELEDNEQFLEAEKEKDSVTKEEAEGGSEDGMEEGLDEERTEEDDDDEEKDGEGDEEGDNLNEPQDLSLVDYSRYNSATLPDAHAAAATVATAEEACVPGAMVSRLQTTGKLNCDICGLSCVSINVLLVHKRSHTGKHRNTAQTPDLKHKSCAIITLVIVYGDSALCFNDKMLD